MTSTAVVLIADDDSMWVQSMVHLLEGEGYRVLSARTGVDALYQTRMRQPDLLLLNPDLPQLSGWEVCRRLKCLPGVDRTKVAMLTLEAEAAYRVGADGYLAKGAKGGADPTPHPSVSISGPRYPGRVPPSTGYCRMNTGTAGVTRRIHPLVMEM